MLKSRGMFIAIIFLSGIGGLFKILGGFIGGSKSVFVDALTSIANTIAIVMMYEFFNISIEPPDEDHHYGHHRIGLGGPILTLMLYSFIAGVIVIDLYETFGNPYTVGILAPIFACIGLIPYTLAIALARYIGGTVTYYARFTAIEIIESGVTIAVAFAGVLINYLIDFIGAIALSSYILIELAKSFKEILEYISDIASKEIVRNIKSILDSHGITAERIRIRKIAEDLYQGDIVVKLPSNISIEEAHQIIDLIEKETKEKLDTEVTIHIEPENGK